MLFFCLSGAGPTGLGAATRLEQLTKDGLSTASDWLLIDAFQEAGGLACTDITAEGFTLLSILSRFSISLLHLHLSALNTFFTHTVTSRIYRISIRYGWSCNLQPL